MTPATSGSILVVGGYGTVGTTVSTTLASWFPGHVLAAGRHPDQRRLGPSIGTVRLDVNDHAAVERAFNEHQITTVVLCVEPPDATFARTCLHRGIHLVDVGASDRILQEVEHIDIATGNQATAVLSVGVAPGLTNLLARQAHDTLGGAERLDITILLGAGEHHGLDAIGWTIGQLGQPPPDRARPQRVTLTGYGTRTAHPFGFSDQYSLRRTLGIPAVTTRLCLDSKLLTAMLFGLRRTGAFRATRTNLLQRLLTQSFSRIHLGRTGFAIRVDGYHGDRHIAYTLSGNEQSRITAHVAAHVARHVHLGALPAGVHHIEQLPALADIPLRLAEHGVVLEVSEAERSAPRCQR